MTTIECPTCKYPLTQSPVASVGWQCPRCNTWLEVDENCMGSCLTCTEHLKARPPKQNQGHTPALMPGRIEEFGRGDNPRRTDLKDPAVEGGVSSS